MSFHKGFTGPGDTVRMDLLLIKVKFRAPSGRGFIFGLCTLPILKQLPLPLVGVVPRSAGIAVVLLQLWQPQKPVQVDSDAWVTLFNPRLVEKTARYWVSAWAFGWRLAGRKVASG
jgi:hypothetical protein